jgi:hypothetical protein
MQSSTRKSALTRCHKENRWPGMRFRPFPALKPAVTDFIDLQEVAARWEVSDYRAGASHAKTVNARLSRLLSSLFPCVPHLFHTLSRSFPLCR